MQATSISFKEQILEGIPNELPQPKPFDHSLNHAPKRKDILNDEEKKLALKNALRYFEKKHHATCYLHDENNQVAQSAL